MENRLPITALGGRSQSKQFLRTNQIDKPRVRLSRGVVKLIYDHDIEVRRIQGTESCHVERLNRSEDMVEFFRATAANPELSETPISENMGKRRTALVEYL